MPMNYDKFFALLKRKKISSYNLKINNIISATTLQRLRAGLSISTDSICKLCYYLDCQPEDIMRYVPD